MKQVKRGKEKMTVLYNREQQRIKCRIINERLEEVNVRKFKSLIYNNSGNPCRKILRLYTTKELND
jgi:hypothetical protein